MKYQITINSNSITAKHVQIAESMRKDIEVGRLTVGAQLPSINKFSKSHIIARDTIEKAYNTLKKEGYIIGVPGKGYFVANNCLKKPKILMMLNKMSTYKKEVYEAFVETIGENVKIDMQIYHYNLNIFREIIEESQGNYQYYVIMPHFSQETPKKSYIKILNSIQNAELVILDREVDLENEVINIFQDFEKDIFEALSIEKEIFYKYNSIVLVFNKLTHHPVEIIDGVRAFCKVEKIKFSIISGADKIIPKKRTAYITLTDNELAVLVNKIRNTKFQLGIDIGILSFNETVLKQLLGITVVSTNFSAMGRIAAEMIFEKKVKSLRNEFIFIKRSSL